jgi:integrase
VKSTIRRLREEYAHTLVNDFGPNMLRAYRDTWINRTYGNEKEYSRGVVNKYTNQAVRIFKWGVSHEMVPVEVYQALATVEGLRMGRSRARETEPIQPVLEGQINAIEPFVSRTIWALVQLQLFTAARPSELLKLRACDIDVSGEIWEAVLKDHKTGYRNKKRILYFGPKAQAILRPFMISRAINAYLFDPHDAIREKAERAYSHRRKGQAPL